MPASPTPPPARARTELEKAARILEAEARAGCRDRAVIGGLAGYLRNFRAQLQDPRADRVCQLLEGYADLDLPTRAARLREAASLLAAALGPRPDGAPRRDDGRPPAGPPPTRTTVRRAEPPAGLGLDSPLHSIKGIGPHRARLYERLGLRTPRDLLFHVPARHLPYPPPSRIADLFFQSEASVEGVLERVETEHLPRGLKKLRATVRDASGSLGAVWLRRGAFHLGIRPGEPIALSGKLLQLGRQLWFENPEYERADAPRIHTRGPVPVHPLTAGLSDRELRGRIHWAVTHFAAALPEPLPAAPRLEHRLLPVDEAVRALHFPTTLAAAEEARRRFAFEELLTIQLVVLQRRRAWQRGGAAPLARRDAALDALIAGLPFTLTNAQRRVADEILRDTAQPRPMTRLLQGEVGSGKTAVAALALLNALANGYQGALMAPTEILAEQHFATLDRLYAAAGGRLEAALGRRPAVRLLTGGVKGKERAAVYAGAADGSIDVLVGTQALLQEALDFARLGLVIVDEQHRFGVKQRVTLRRRARGASATDAPAEPPGPVPHLLVMTATPIPRTLALSLYGDLDLSAIDQLPPGRPAVKTVLLDASERQLAYERVRRAAARGHQSFIICPLVEESEALEAKAATEEFERLRGGELATLRLALLHGRMRPAEKDAVMRAFRDHAFDVLVSTAVVEVGVDVPNASVMLIEGAERFGLAQLHQFRGRVGRGEHPSVCILLTERADAQASERLRVVERSSNGLALAEHDLRLRGPGDYFGVRQSGFPELKVARLDDAGLVEAARAAAAEILAADPELRQPDHAPLREHLVAFQARAGEPS